MGKGNIFMKKRKSLGIKILMSFTVTSIIPIIIINMFSYYNISKIVNDNNDDLMRYNLNQTKTALDITMESYLDVLYQIYADDDVVNLIYKINNHMDTAVSKSQLRRVLRGYFYAKKHIKDISIITADGTLIFYDAITGSTTRSSWLANIGMSQEELYNAYIGEKKSFAIPTQATLNGDYFLFHLGHRIVDFNRKNEELGIVILSVDEELLHGICNGGQEKMPVYSFIVDDEGRLVSYQDKQLLGSFLNLQGENKIQGYEEFARRQKIFGENDVNVECIVEERFGWDIVSISDQNEILGRIHRQQRLVFTILAAAITFLAVIIMFFTRSLTGSIRTVVKTMQSAGQGRPFQRIQIDRKMPKEVEAIACQYNTTMDQLMESVEKEKQLDRQKKDAEITALEAQINPHFLYNTLDTINWIAIGKKEFEISRAISALAVILRYGIDNSNGIVTVREEYEWLKQYLFLQQTRLKDGFESMIEIPPELMEIKVHKLLIQPFVENSFIHGFENIKRKPMLKIRMQRWEQNRIQILIEDNGKGMPQEVASRMNQGVFQESEDKNQIGLKNAVYRIRLYYEENADIQVESQENAYTRIYITLPIISEEGKD